MIASEAKYHPGCLLALYSKANKCIGDDTKAAAHQIPNCIKKTINTRAQLVLRWPTGT